jgi:hypothetical protein
MREYIVGRLRERVAGAFLDLLIDDFAAALDVVGDLRLRGVEHGHDAPDAGLGAGVDGEVDHRPAGQSMENFRRSRPHAGAQTGG